MADPGAACWRRIGVSGDRSCPELTTHIHCRNCPVFVAEGRRLLDRPTPDAGYLKGWSEILGAERPQEEHGVGTLVVFRIGAEWFAVEAAVVERACAASRPVPIPHRTGAALAGLVNVAGELLLCVWLAGLLGVTAASPAARPAGRLLVIARQGERWAIAVDEVLGLVASPARGLTVPTSVARAHDAFTRRLVAVDDLHVAELDGEGLFARLRGLLPGAS